MSLEVKIPAVGESITSGLLSTWHKNDGDMVKAGEALLTLETDKVSTEITAEKAGRLEIKVPAGKEVQIGEVVAVIEEEEGATSESRSSTPAVAPLASPTSVAPAHTMKAAPAPKKSGGAEKTSRPEPVSPPAPAIIEPPEDAARELGQVSAAPPPAGAGPSTPERDGARFTRKKMSPLRRKIAAQLVTAQQTAAILTTFNE
ncbi:MAG TPA: biotin/lipoyl-containing protein, partial [Chthoniobacteraceae bacterium]|nr:biotin/lipoyl-containing protein [Chthoniobacteraceae bacterium]